MKYPFALRRWSVAALVPFVWLAAAAHAEVVLAPLFRDGAVLQRDMPVPVWGHADPGEHVRIQFHAQTVEVSAGPDGRWRVDLAAEPASVEPAKLVVTGKNTITVSDVLVGEVWLCSGQSNMAWAVSTAANPEQEAAMADHPLIRHFKVEQAVAEAPADDLEGAWVACRPDTVLEFSAVAYFFGRELQQRLDVPVGLINSSWGGTQIESWMSAEALAKEPALESITAQWNERLAAFPVAQAKYEEAMWTWQQAADAAKAAGKEFKRRAPRAPEGPGSRWLPSGLYNAMIAPLVPGAIRGVIWYQGEANADRYAEYRTLFPGMIRQWRSDFGREDLPFFYVQLANFTVKADTTGTLWAFQREAQMEALSLPMTGQAVAIDIGDPGNIHPMNKQETGRRLALQALARVYGLGGECDGPMLAGVAAEGHALRVTFSHAAGLRISDPVTARAGAPVYSPAHEMVAASATGSGAGGDTQAGFVCVPSVFKEAGVAVVPWTVNDKARMLELMGWGVDGLISDRPDLLREAVREFDGNSDGRSRHWLTPAGLVDRSRFDAQGHRGARDLRPENTLPAMEAALDLLMSTLELDCGVTCDGVAILGHDARLPADKARRVDGRPYTKDDEITIADWTVADLQATFVADGLARGPQQQRDVGLSPVSMAFAEATMGAADANLIYRVPTLEQVFEFVAFYRDFYANGAGRMRAEATVRAENARLVRFNIEPKIRRSEKGVRTADVDAFVEAIAGLAAKRGLESRVDVQCFDYRVLDLVRERHPAIRTVYLMSDMSKVKSLPADTPPWLRDLLEGRTAPVAADERLSQAFEVAGADGVYHPAMARIEGQTVLVWSPDVPAPVTVRYAWHNTPSAPLYNAAGLPASPFRSDRR